MPNIIRCKENDTEILTKNCVCVCVCVCVGGEERGSGERAQKCCDEMLSFLHRVTSAKELYIYFILMAKTTLG